MHITFIVCIFVVDKRGKALQDTHTNLNNMRKYENYLEKLLPFDKVAIKGLAKSLVRENNNRVSKKMPRCITFPNYRVNGTSNKYLYGI